MLVARAERMDNEARYAYTCRVVLAAAAGVHWVAALMMMSDRFNTVSGWEYSRSVRRLAAGIIQALIAG
jgi:hypothetical protein